MARPWVHSVQVAAVPSVQVGSRRRGGTDTRTGTRTHTHIHTQAHTHLLEVVLLGNHHLLALAVEHSAAVHGQALGVAHRVKPASKCGVHTYTHTLAEC